jgi:AcrR family transcriptional regulator
VSEEAAVGQPKERSSAGDPVRTLELLWRLPPESGTGRGPKQRSSVEAVVAAAIEIADVEGIGALTMRAVANRLGLTPMATYTYVPGKAELIDLMLDTVYARMERADLTGLPWRQRVVRIAAENRAMLARHPWVAYLPTTRPPLGPGLAAKYEHELGAFADLGLDDVEMDAALTFVLGFVTSVARIAIDSARAAGGPPRAVVGTGRARAGSGVRRGALPARRPCRHGRGPGARRRLQR